MKQTRINHNTALETLPQSSQTLPCGFTANAKRERRFGQVCDLSIMKPDWKTDPAFVKALAWASRRVQPQEKFVLEQIILRPRESDDLLKNVIRENPAWVKVSKASLSKSVSKARKALHDFYLSSEGIASPKRYAISEGTPWQIEVEQNVITPSSQFWLGHLQNGRRTCIVMGEPYSNRNIGSGVFETSLTRRPKAAVMKPLPKQPTSSHPFPGMQLPPGESLEREESKDTIDDNEIPRPTPPPSPVEALLSGDPFRVVRLGDVRAALSIYSYFKDWHDDNLGYSEPDVISIQDKGRSEQDNLVVLGTTTNDRALIATKWDSRFCLHLGDGNMLFEQYASGKWSAKGCGEYPRSCYVLVSRTGSTG